MKQRLRCCSCGTWWNKDAQSLWLNVLLFHYNIMTLILWHIMSWQIFLREASQTPPPLQEGTAPPHPPWRPWRNSFAPSLPLTKVPLIFHSFYCRYDTAPHFHQYRYIARSTTLSFRWREHVCGASSSMIFMRSFSGDGHAMGSAESGLWRLYELGAVHERVQKL